jgi:hypothetical protein
MMEPRNPEHERRPEGQGAPARAPEFQRDERTGSDVERGDDFQRSPSGGQFRPADTENRPNQGQGRPNKKK